jgi:hypothetical protein
MPCRYLIPVSVWLAVGLLQPTAVFSERPAPVPPALEIEVLDPNVDPSGNPAVIVRDRGNGRSSIEIPPVVLVHRYFYTGDRSFQGPMLPGGPSILVVHHPRTGEQCYVPVQMLPGAPRVHYSSGKIEYDYGRHGITLSFGLFGQPKVSYRNHRSVHHTAVETVAKAHDHLGNAWENSGLSKAAKGGAQSTKGFFTSTSNGVKDAGKAFFTPAKQLVQSTPLGALFRDKTEEHARRQRDREVRAAAEASARRAISLSTLR